MVPISNQCIKMKKRIAIIGAGDLGKSISYYIKTDSSTCIFVGYFDDIKKEGDILGPISDVFTSEGRSKYDEIIIGIGYKHLGFKKKLFQSILDAGIILHTFIHSSSYVDPSCTIGLGTCVFPGAILDMNVQIGNSCIINTGSLIAHDSIIGDFSFLAPSVSIAGFVKICAQVNLGINTTIIDNINISKPIRTGGGCVIISSIDKSGLYVGVPSRLVKEYK